MQIVRAWRRIHSATPVTSDMSKLLIYVNIYPWYTLQGVKDVFRVLITRDGSYSEFGILCTN